MHSKGGIMNIAGTHAPHSAIPTQDKLLCHKLKEIAEQYGKHNQHSILLWEILRQNRQKTPGRERAY